MVKVLPMPVTPSSVWCAKPVVQALDELLDRLRLIAGGLVVGFESEGNLRFHAG